MVPITNPTCLQSSDARGMVIDFNNGQPILPIIGVISFSNDDKHGTNYSDYSGSLIEEYVNNYKNILEINFGVEVEEARLITYDEVTEKNTFACDIGGNCSSKYPWIYSTTYWTNSAPDANNVRVVVSVSQYNSVACNSAGAGVRPVIIISKDYFN